MVVNIRDIIDDVLNNPKNLIPLGKPIHVVVPALYHYDHKLRIPKGIKVISSIYDKDEYRYRRWRVINIKPRYYTNIEPRDVIIDSDFSKGDDLKNYIRIYDFTNKSKLAIYFQEMNEGEDNGV